MIRISAISGPGIFGTKDNNPRELQKKSEMALGPVLCGRQVELLQQRAKSRVVVQALQ